MPSSDSAIAELEVTRGLALRLLDDWALWRELSANDQSFVEDLNRCAPEFFGRFQRLLVDEILLSLSRFNEGKKRFGLLSLARHVRQLRGPESEAALKPLIDRYQISCERIREHRNRRIAHHDPQVVLDPSTLDGVSVSEVQLAIDRLKEALSALDRALGGNAPNLDAYVEARGAGQLREMIRNSLGLRALNTRLLWRTSSDERKEMSRQEVLQIVREFVSGSRPLFRQTLGYSDGQPEAEEN